MGSARKRPKVQAAYLLIIFGSLFGFHLSAFCQDVHTVGAISSDGESRRRSIPIPFSEPELWNEAIRRALEKDYWGTNRVFVKMTPTADPVLCRVISQQDITVWFDGFKKGSQAGTSWAENQIQYQAFVSELLNLSRPELLSLSFGACGTYANPKAVVLMHNKSRNYFWLDAAGAAPPQLCSIEVPRIGPEPRAQFICQAVSDDPRILRGVRRIGMSLNSMRAGVIDDVVSVRADSDDLVDLCTVNTVPAVPKDGVITFLAGGEDKLPHAIASGSLQLPGGKKIDKATIGILTCKIRALDGSFHAETIVYPDTWIGIKGTRTWADIDADGRADYCRIVSAIGPSTTSALLMCTILREGGVFGDTVVDLVDID